jgi:hypothetical protein
MKQALEALEKVIIAFGPGLTLQQRAITALRQALVDADDTSQERVDEIVKDEHEPVAWANSSDLQNFDMRVRTGPDLHHTVPLYTAPPKREWVGLTDEEIHQAFCHVGYETPHDWNKDPESWCIANAKYLQAILKEKNHG